MSVAEERGFFGVTYKAPDGLAPMFRLFSGLVRRLDRKWSTSIAIIWISPGFQNDGSDHRVPCHFFEY